MAISRKLLDDQIGHQHTLTGKGGLVLKVIDLGAAITNLLVPDKHGDLIDVVLGYPNLLSYAEDKNYMGCVIGRVAGRIRGARVRLEGKEHALTENEGSNHLHGGTRGLHKRLWTPTRTCASFSEVSLCLTCTSPSEDEGYPGRLTVEVRYTVTDLNDLKIECEATTNQITPYSLTHHAYFNLSGTGGQIGDHTLQICSDRYAPLVSDMTVSDRLESVEGRANDLRQPQLLRDVIPHLDYRHGDLYRIVPQDKVSLKHAARLTHPSTGIVMDVHTTWSYLQFYTGMGIDGAVSGRLGSPYRPYAGVCLECEDYPNGVNAPHMGRCILRPGTRRKDVTLFTFSNQVTPFDLQVRKFGHRYYPADAKRARKEGEYT